MRGESHSLIGLLADAFQKWRLRERLSRETVVQLFIEKYSALGGPEVTGLVFDPQTKDPVERMKVNADRFYRWLDDKTKDSTLLPANLLPFVIAALPVDLRLSVVNDMLGFSGLGVHVLSQGQQLSIIELVQDVARESAEATASLAGLADGHDPVERANVRRQLTESIASAERALHVVEGLEGEDKA